MKVVIHHLTWSLYLFFFCRPIWIGKRFWTVNHQSDNTHHVPCCDILVVYLLLFVKNAVKTDFNFMKMCQHSSTLTYFNLQIKKSEDKKSQMKSIEHRNILTHEFCFFIWKKKCHSVACQCKYSVRKVVSQYIPLKSILMVQCFDQSS